MLVAPSILSADFCNLQKDIEMINNSQADMIHIDIMDGVFVPNISVGIPVVKAVAAVAKKPLDVHLMIVNPEKFIGTFKELGATWLNVHYEACTHLNRVVNEIRQAGMKTAVTLNPATPVSVLEEILPELDMVLLMTVNPGFGGQKFIESSISKVKKLRELIKATESHAIIEVDGGVTLETGKRLAQAGVDVLVSGNTIFKSENPIETIGLLKKL